ncbi:hypothetical protein NE237_019944 [Protea cynaroides]|uniref:Uncharacterized protein n=1 Tax=Protea cynaroides TaxID=273540 RepID=A0A9Q0K168_9MAGN|nr:hypothetical protein NE237_019944 [Protea cynaroides]
MQPTGTSANMLLAVNHQGNQNLPAVIENPSQNEQTDENQLQFNMNSLYDSMDSSSSSSNTPADANNTSSGLPSMKYEELFGSASQLSNENGNGNVNVNVALGSEGGSLQVPVWTPQNPSDPTMDLTYATSAENNFQFGWEGIPDVFEGFDDPNAAGNYLYVDDSSGLCDLFRSYLLQVRSPPQQFGNFDFNRLYPGKTVYQLGQFFVLRADSYYL